MATSISRASTAFTYGQGDEIEGGDNGHYQPAPPERRFSAFSDPTIIGRRGSNQSYYSLLDSADPKPVSLESLFELKALLDAECFKLTTRKNAAADADLYNHKVTYLAVRLSEPLVMCYDEEVSAFLEMQLRTLIAAFALLHFRGVRQLPAEIYDDLKNKKLGSLYSTITQQKKEGEDPITSTNLYLIQLALQYLYLFGCSRNREYESTRPVLDIIFATLMMPAQQYQHSINIVTGIQELTRIWRKREPKQHPLCAIQEHVRRVQEAMSGKYDPITLSTPIEEMLAATLDQIGEILEIEINGKPDKLNNWHTTRNAFQLGPPEINSRYYLYGVLDCTAAVGSRIDLRALRPKLYKTLETFALKTSVNEFRWKTIEVLLSFEATRQETRGSFLQKVKDRWTLLLPHRSDLVAGIEMVYSMLQDGEVGPVRRRKSEPVSNVLYPQRSLVTAEIQDTNPITPCRSIDEESDPTTAVGSMNADIWSETRLRQFRPRNTASKPQDFSTALKKLGGSSLEIVGFSSNARRVFFISEKYTSIFDINCQAISDPLVFKREKGDASRVKAAVLTENFMLFVNSKGSLSSIVVKTLTDKTTVLEYSPFSGQIRAVVARETTQLLFLLIAQGDGQILVFKLDKTRTSWQAVTPSSKLRVNNSFVKHMSLSPRNDSIVALTHANVLYVWPTGPDLTRQVTPFRYWHGTYSPDGGDNSTRTKGLTSASLFSPLGSLNTYTFCSSFPSRNRCDSKGNWETNGEWSFITPTHHHQHRDRDRDHDQGQDTPPTPTIAYTPSSPSPSSSSSTSPLSSSSLRQNLTQFAKSGGLTTGVVSNTANVFAVLERMPHGGEKRRVLWMPIRSGGKERGGGVVCPSATKPNVLESITLEGKDQTDDPGRGSCALAFQESTQLKKKEKEQEQKREGEGDEQPVTLVAADLKGRVWKVVFEESGA